VLRVRRGLMLARPDDARECQADDARVALLRAPGKKLAYFACAAFPQESAAEDRPQQPRNWSGRRGS